jgi:hypothetical protein
MAQLLPVMLCFLLQEDPLSPGLLMMSLLLHLLLLASGELRH